MDELNYILNNICSEESEHRFTQLSEIETKDGLTRLETSNIGLVRQKTLHRLALLV